MFIERIELDNYRSHKHVELELSQGINLILGENGSGKSSILEAISMLLFSIRGRTGKKRSSKDFMRHGAKKTKMQIDFNANDGRSYRVTQEVDRKTSKLSLMDLATEELYEEADLTDKIQELCGIKKNFGDIYEHIIVAKQNEFIHIFKAKPAERAEVFHKVFQTEIYTEMAAKYFKAAEDAYKEKARSLGLEIKLLEESMEASASVEEEVKDLKQSLKSIETEEKVLAKEKEVAKKERVKLEEKKRLEEEEKKKLENLGEEALKTKTRLRALLSKTKTAKEAKAVLVAEEKGYLDYQKLAKDLEAKQAEEEKLAAQEKENQGHIRAAEKLTWELEQEGKMQEEAKAKEAESLANYEALVERLEKAHKEAKAITEKGEAYKKVLLSCQSLEEDLKGLADTKQSKEASLEHLQKDCKLKEEKLASLQEAKLEKAWKALKGKKEALGRCKQEIVICEEKRNVFLEARQQLEGRHCFLLDEECKNIKDKDPAGYFADKLAFLDEREAKLQKEAGILEEALQIEERLGRSLQEAKLLQEEVQKYRLFLPEEALVIKNIELEMQKLCLEEEKLLFRHGMNSKEELEGSVQELRVKWASLGIAEKEKEEEKGRKALEEFRRGSERRRYEMAEKRSRLKALEAKIRPELTKAYAEVSQERRELSEALQGLEKSYRSYLESHALAEEFNPLLEELGKEWQQYRELQAKKRETSQALQDFEEAHTQEELEAAKVLEAEKEKALSELQMEVARSRERLEHLSLALEKYKAAKKDVAKKKKEVQKTETKAQKTKSLRGNVKEMALQISKYMLESISQMASKNFHKMTGRGESILWSNEDKDKYGVYLVGALGKTPFDNLSGGEQVVVAISLRESLTEYFSNARFMILDEPTNNLDQERKKLLAEYMGEMLGSLDQSIIVTHDNTFREMAERVIEL